MVQASEPEPTKYHRQCGTPGCSLPDWHTGLCEPLRHLDGPEYARRRPFGYSEVRPPQAKGPVASHQGPRQKRPRTDSERTAAAVLVARLVAFQGSQRWALPPPAAPSGSSAIVASSGVCSSARKAEPAIDTESDWSVTSPESRAPAPTHLTTPLAITCSPRHSHGLWLTSHLGGRLRRASGFAR